MTARQTAVNSALSWIRQGASPIPVPHKQKAPILAGWQNLKVTEANLQQYFNGELQNIGILLGEPSNGLIDIDLDCSEAITIAPVYFPETASFGRASRPRSHLLYSCPGAKTVQFSHKGMLLEIRSTGCQTLVPGSVHPSGELIEGTPGEDDIRTIEVNALNNAAGCTAAAALLAREWRKLSGERHETTLALAGALLHAGWNAEEIKIFVKAVINASGDDDAADRMRAAQDTIEKHINGERVTGWPTVAEHLSDNIVKKLRKWLAIDDKPQLKIKSSAPSNNESPNSSDEWPEPEPLRREVSPAEPFPLDALGDVLGPMAREMMNIVQSPDAVCAQSVLAAAALAVQAYANVEIDGRDYPLSNFFITVAETGERKTATDREALAAHSKFQYDMKLAYQEQLAEYEAGYAAWKKARDEALSSKQNKSREAKREAVLKLGPCPQPPPNPILMSEEPTYEGLVKALAADWPSMGIFSDEGGRFLGGHGMNRDNQLKTAAGLSKLWDGGPITRTRSGEGNIVLYGRRVSLHLMVQPNVSALLFGNELLQGQGLLSRCLVTYPQSRIGKRPYKEIVLRETPAFRRYFACMMGILETPLPLTKDSMNELSPRQVSLEPGAKSTWIQFHDHIERLCKEHRELSSIRGLAAKAAEHALRLAGVLVLVDDLHLTTISGRYIEASIEIVQHHLNEALRLFEIKANDPDLELADTLLAWLQQRLKVSQISQVSQVVYLQQVYQQGPRPIRSKETAEKILDILEQHNWVKRIEGGAEIDGRHRHRVWEIRST